MDIKELVERVRLTDWEIESVTARALLDNPHWEVDAWGLFSMVAQAQLNKVLKEDLALVIRDGDEVPLGVEIETHHVVLLKKALKEVNDD